MSLRVSCFKKIHFTNCRFDSQLDKKIDVFAYEMTVFWLAAGKKPWAAISNADEIEALVVAGERPKFNPEEESNEVKKLLETVEDPKDRPSFEELLFYWIEINSHYFIATDKTAFHQAHQKTHQWSRARPLQHNPQTKI